MWCKECRQDVPGLASAIAGDCCCARCGSVLSARSVDVHGTHTVGVAASASHGVDLCVSSRKAAPPLDDDWDFKEDYRQLRRIANGVGLSQLASSNSMAPEPQIHDRQSHDRRLDPLPAIDHRRLSESRPLRPLQPRLPLLAYAILTISSVAFLGGAALLAWSLFGGRSELWNFGLPITIGGQLGLLLGLVLQLQRIYQAGRMTVTKLQEVDERLHDLKQSTALLSTTHSSAAQSFYTHMAQGANPQVLLADLKGQLDLLAIRMAQQT